MPKFPATITMLDHVMNRELQFDAERQDLNIIWSALRGYKASGYPDDKRKERREGRALVMAQMMERHLKIHEELFDANGKSDPASRVQKRT